MQHLAIYKLYAGGTTPFRVRCRFVFTGNSAEERLFRTYGAPMFTEPPLDYDAGKPAPPALLTRDQFAALTTPEGADIDFADVRKADLFIEAMERAYLELPAYWQRAELFMRGDSRVIPLSPA